MSGDRPTGCNRSKALSLRREYVVKLSVSNVLARNRCTTGVQGTPKSFGVSLMWNVETSYLRLIQAGETVRACPHEGGGTLLEVRD